MGYQDSTHRAGRQGKKRGNVGNVEGTGNGEMGQEKDSVWKLLFLGTGYRLESFA